MCIYSRMNLSQDWDFFSDPTVELNEFVYASGVNGVVTDFPQTATLYEKNRCLTMSSPPTFAGAVPRRGLFAVMNPVLRPPAEAPSPVLTISDVSEPALSPAIDIVPAPEPSTPSQRFNIFVGRSDVAIRGVPEIGFIRFVDILAEVLN
ncbi:Glycerophosphodiester phosphodiesterase GDPDL1-like protein [Drosera capensis]